MKTWISIVSIGAAAALALVVGACAPGTGVAQNGVSGSCSASVPSSCSSTPSYASDVAPILASACTSCHSAGGEQSNKPLDSYASVARLASEVQSQLATCAMPPGSASLSSSDADKVLLWIECGAPNN